MIYDIVAIIVVLLLGIIAPSLGGKRFRSLRRGWKWLARRKWLCVAIVGIWTFAISAALSFFVHFPHPAVHDEFAYLLGADTLASGRLSNPTHPMWEHFESFHIIHQPTYQMKYPPGQAIALAVGQLIWHPIVGVWLSLALACAATCWMLQGWLPPRWALLGALFCTLNPPLLVAWGQTYWGGAVAMLGGALVFGSLPRLLRRPRAGMAVILALGLVILANSRPYEGAVASLPVAVVMLWAVLSKRVSMVDFFRRIALPVAVILLLGFTWIGYYNYRVTGKPMTMPYQVWQRIYAGGTVAAHMFAFNNSRAERPPQRRLPLPRMAAPHGTPFGKMARLWAFYISAILTMPLLASLLLRGNARFALFVCALVLSAVVLQSTRPHPHYAAPATCLVFFLAAQGCRRLQLCRIAGRPVGRFFVRMLPLLLVFSASTRAVQWNLSTMYSWKLHKARIERDVSETDELDLVLVRYNRRHILHHEWVYNRADIDAAPIVWARELSPEKNRRLLEYFAGRRVWLLEADAPTPLLVPYAP